MLRNLFLTQTNLNCFLLSASGPQCIQITRVHLYICIMYLSFYFFVFFHCMHCYSYIFLVVVTVCSSYSRRNGIWCYIPLLILVSNVKAFRDFRSKTYIFFINLFYADDFTQLNVNVILSTNFAYLWFFDLGSFIGHFVLIWHCSGNIGENYFLGSLHFWSNFSASFSWIALKSICN